MALLAILVGLIQVGFAVHAVRTGKEQFWLFLILGLPGLGCTIYFFTQVLPELGSNRKVREAKRSIVGALDPTRELRRRKEALTITDSIANRMALADECHEGGLLSEAWELYEQCLVPPDANNPDLLLKLATVQLDSGEAVAARASLERLIEHNPEFRSSAGHLLYARALAAVGEADAAQSEYEAVVPQFAGEEARVRFALFQQERGEVAAAQALFAEALLRAKQSPKYYREREHQWLELARANSDRAR